MLTTHPHVAPKCRTNTFATPHSPFIGLQGVNTGSCIFYFTGCVRSCSSQENYVYSVTVFILGILRELSLYSTPAVQFEMTKSFDTQIYYYETDNFVDCNKSRLPKGTEVAKYKTEIL